MIKLKTSDLKVFFKRTKGIKHHNIMPILAYFKMDCIGDKVVITDTNSHTYVIHEMPGEFDKKGSYLIDRKMMSSIVDTTNSECITIEQKGKKIILSDQLGNQSFQTDDPTLYNKVPDRNNVNHKKINADFMNALQIAKHYCDTNPKTAGVNPLEAIHVIGTPDYSEIFACDKFRLYGKKIDGDGINMILLPETCSLLAGFEEALFYEADNYLFFDCGMTTYGFIKTELKAPPFSSITSGADESKSFVIEKEKIVSFCNRTLSLNPSANFPECFIKDAGENKVLFVFNNTDHDVDCDMTFEVTKNFEAEPFMFNADQFLKLINPLPYNKLIFIPHKDRYYIKSDEDKNFIGLIQRLVNL